MGQTYSPPTWLPKFGAALFAFFAALTIAAGLLGLFGDWSQETVATAFFFFAVNPLTLAALLVLGVLGAWLRRRPLCFIALVLGALEAVGWLLMAPQE